MSTAGAAGGIGAIILIVLLVAIGFAILVAILRWVFGIAKIVNLLGVIAQEVRAANAAQGIDAKLKTNGINEQLGEYLNDLILKDYKVTVQEENKDAAESTE